MTAEKPASPWGYLIKEIRGYFRAYGGVRALLRSPYLHLAAFFTAISLPWWSESEWWETAIELVPSFLGLTLAGFAMIMAFGSERFVHLMAVAGGEHSVLERSSASFVHFVVVQLLAIVAAVSAKVLSPLDWSLHLSQLNRFEHAPYLVEAARLGAHGLGFFLLAYSLCSALAIALRLYGMARMLTKAERLKEEQRAE